MKATINGIIVEGTPEEIVKYQALTGQYNIKPVEVKLKGSVSVDEFSQALQKVIKSAKLINPNVYFGEHNPYELLGE